MAIVKMSNFSLFAFDSERDNLLHELQKFGYVHFSSLDKDESLMEEGLEALTIPESIGEVDEEISKVKYSIDLLSKHYTRETGIKAMIKGKDNLTFEELELKALAIDYIPIYDELKLQASKLDEMDLETKGLVSLREELSNWEKLNYPIGDLGIFQQSQVFMGTIPKKMKDKLDEDLLNVEYTYFETIHEDKDNVYVFALTLKKEAEALNEILRGNSFSSIRLTGEKTPREEINIINERLKEFEAKNNEIKDSIKKLSDNLPDFEIIYEYLINKKLRLAASEKFLMTERVNVIKGYIPTSMTDEFIKAVGKSLKDAYHLEIEEVDKDDPSAPVLLKNSKFAESFESLTAMYALPRYNEIDPTPFLAPFYLAFFGMMVGDAGYGLLMLIGTFIALKVANLGDGDKKFIRFFHYLSYSVIVWGVVFGSYFGGIIPIKGLIEPATQYQELLVVSIVFGLIHLFFGLGIKAYLSLRDKKYLDAIFDVGFWYMAIAGGIVFLLSSIVPAVSAMKTASLAVMVIGMVGIVLTGGRDADTIGGKAGGGLYSLYGISSYVGDLVSYSRLMALGLAGGFISGSINMMMEMLFDKGIGGIIGGIIVFLVGQLFNLFLSVLGAYVHTSRLTYVEFFGKFFEGGGEGFNLFRSKTKYINLK